MMRVVSAVVLMLLAAATALAQGQSGSRLSKALVSRPDVGTVRYEDTVIVTEAEPEVLTSTCKPRWW